MEKTPILNHWDLLRFEWNQSHRLEFDWRWPFLDRRRWSGLNWQCTTACNLGNCTLSLSPPHVWAHLIEFWWMLQSAGWGVNQIKSPIDSCTQWDSDQTKIDSDQAQIHSTCSCSVSLLVICAPWARSPVFAINKAHITSSKLVRTGIEVLLLLYCCYCLLFLNKESLEARSMV